MGNNTSASDGVLTMQRPGPLTPFSERHGRTVAPASRYGSPSHPQRPIIANRGTTKSLTRGEIEAALCVGIGRFELEYLGRGPTEIRGHLIGDLVVLRLSGVLTLAEQQLITSADVAKGRDLVKQVRTQIIEIARPLIAAMIEDVTGVALISLHHDLSTTTGEECFIFTLAAEPDFREVIRKGK